jgi:hypothetical protein
MSLSRISLLLAPLALAAAAPPLYESYKDVSLQIIAAALIDQDGYAKLSYLCDRIGNRISGSTSLNDAIQWAAAQMKRDGLEHAHYVGFGRQRGHAGGRHHGSGGYR